MKPIEANNQAKLGWVRCGRLALSGMSYRMLRSGITTAILALAVAFLVYSVSYSILAERTRAAGWDELRPTREAVRMLSRLSTPDTLASIRQRLAEDDDLKLEELRHWYRGGDEPWDQARQGAKAFALTQRWFDKLSPAASAVLLGGRDLATLMDQIEYTTDTVLYDEFTARVEDLGLGRSWANHASEAGDMTLSRWIVLQEVARVVQSGHTRAINSLRGGGGGWAERLLNSNDSVVIRGELENAGFLMTDSDWRELVEYLHYNHWVSGVQALIQQPRVKQQIRQRWGDDTLLSAMSSLQDPSGEHASWWAVEIDASLDPGQFWSLADRYVRELRLAEVAEGYEPTVETRPLGLAPSTLWLVGLSLLVCIVGVTNALLMSVTERFNEIATMKCLGAMDGSVMRVFVIEALVQGVLGGTAGVVLGVLLAVLRGGLEFGGTLALAAGATGQVLGAAAISLGVGVLLATLAAIGPSWIASRLSPMEAMRVE